MIRADFRFFYPIDLALLPEPLKDCIKVCKEVGTLMLEPTRKDIECAKLYMRAIDCSRVSLLNETHLVFDCSSERRNAQVHLGIHVSLTYAGLPLLCYIFQKRKGSFSEYLKFFTNPWREYVPFPGIWNSHRAT